MKIALLLLSLLAVATARKRPRIHYGRVVSQSEMESTFPFVVNTIVCVNGNCSSCTGSLVSKDTILTAAHCACTDDPIYVYFKSNKITEGTPIAAKVKWINENYDCSLKTFPFHHDIATLKLSKPITDITPISLDCRNERMGEDIIIIGYGTDERGHLGTLKIGFQNVGSCQTTQYPVICADVYSGRRDRIDFGDSGGPLLVSSGSGFKQLGIAVGMTDEWGPRTVQVYNRVKPFCQRILQ